MSASILHKARVRRLLNRWYDDSPLRNQWITVGPLKVYVRKGQFPLNGRVINGITLANVVVSPTRQGQGYFAPVLEWMFEKLDSDPLVDGLCIENVSSPRLASILERHGWTRVHMQHDLDGVDQFFKLFCDDR
jgi:hypothetical protein